jgi:hypothetical protein
MPRKSFTRACTSSGARIRMTLWQKKMAQTVIMAGEGGGCGMAGQVVPVFTPPYSERHLDDSGIVPCALTKRDTPSLYPHITCFLVRDTGHNVVRPDSLCHMLQSNRGSVS